MIDLERDDPDYALKQTPFGKVIMKLDLFKRYLLKNNDQRIFKIFDLGQYVSQEKLLKFLQLFSLEFDAE